MCLKSGGPGSQRWRWHYYRRRDPETLSRDAIDHEGCGRVLTCNSVRGVLARHGRYAGDWRTTSDASASGRPPCLLRVSGAEKRSQLRGFGMGTRVTRMVSRAPITYGISGSSIRRRRSRSSSCPPYARNHVLHCWSRSGPSGIRLISTDLNSPRISANVSPAPIATKTASCSMALMYGLAASATAQAKLASCTIRSTITTHSSLALAQSLRPALVAAKTFPPLPTGRPCASNLHSS